VILIEYTHFKQRIDSNARSERTKSTHEVNAGTPRILKYSEKSNINAKMLNKLFDKQLWQGHLPSGTRRWKLTSRLVLILASLVFENAVFYPKKD
jgi:hypothetical protein